MGDKYYKDENEVLLRANEILGQSLNDLYGEDSNIYERGKGSFGNKIERLHYGIENNSRPEPDIQNLGIEIKTNPLGKRADGTLFPIERVSLGMIDFTSITKESFHNSSFIRKNKKILYNMYLSDKNLRDYDYKILLADIIEISETDLSVIENDWKLIKHKAEQLDAENLSQSDTKYLVAATKGGKNQIPMPYLEGRAYAKRRSFAFKQCYIKNLLENYELVPYKDVFIFKKSLNKSQVRKTKILDSESAGNIELSVLKKFQKYLHKTDVDIATMFGEQTKFYKGIDKSRWHYNTSLILIGEKKKYLSKHIDEFSKSGITVKTIRTNGDFRPLEEISFRTQDYNICKESEWKESSLYEEVGKIFLWVVYKQSGDKTTLDKVFFWTMPKKDLNFIKKKWMEYKDLILNKEFKPSYFMYDNSFYYLKIKDRKGGANKILNEENVTSLSHWFRKDYVMDIILSN